MSLEDKRNKGISLIENYSLAHNNEMLTITFHEGDRYRCLCNDGSWEDNGEWNPGEDTRNLPGFEEWYELSLHVEEILAPGPNKDPRYEWIFISRKHMPCKVTAGDTVLYEE